MNEELDVISKCESQYYGVASSGNKYKQNCIGHRMSPVLHNKLAKYDIIQSFFVHPIIKNIIIDMKCV